MARQLFILPALLTEQAWHKIIILFENKLWKHEKKKSKQKKILKSPDNIKNNSEFYKHDT